MSGFLDKNERVVDMVLTGEGKYLLMKGELNFVYYSFFDDETDYTPFVSNSSSLSETQFSASLQRLIEDTPIREATTGYRQFNKVGLDNTNVNRPVFTMPQGQVVLPVMATIVAPTGVAEINVTQQKIVDVHVNTDEAGNVLQSIGPIDRGYQRTNSSTVTIELGYSKDSYPKDHQYEGFLVRVFQSGAEGWQEVGERYDLQNDVCYNNDLKIFAGGTSAKVI